MSQWYEAGEEEIDISDDKKTLEVWVKEDYNGNVYVELPIDIVRKKLLNVPEGQSLNAVLGEVRADVQELLQMIAEIPCTCDKIYTDRKLRAPDCPRCNWVEDDIVKKVNEHFA